MAEEIRPPRQRRANPRKVREGTVASTSDGQDRGRRRRRPCSCTAGTTRPSSAPTSSTSMTRPTIVDVGDKVRVQETRPLSKLKRWRVVDSPGACTMIQQESRLRVADNSGAKEVLLHQGARRHSSPLRLDRRHLRRHGQGRHAPAPRSRRVTSSKCVVVRVEKEKRRPDGSATSFR